MPRRARNVSGGWPRARAEALGLAGAVQRDFRASAPYAPVREPVLEENPRRPAGQGSIPRSVPGPRYARSRYTGPSPTALVLEVFMARITVEDCLHNIPNLFQLVLVAAKRARKLANGAEPTVEWENDKPTVVALREIAAGHIGPEILEEVERPAPEMLPEMEMPAMSGELRAPHLGLGD